MSIDETSPHEVREITNNIVKAMDLLREAVYALESLGNCLSIEDLEHLKKVADGIRDGDDHA